MAKTAALRTHDQFSRCRRRKKTQSNDQYSLSALQPSKKLEMGQVKILKRGEELKAKLLFGRENKDLELKLCSTDDHDVKKEIELYAGSASMISSPPPSSQPYPSFLVRRNQLTMIENHLKKLLGIGSPTGPSRTI